MCQWQCDIYIFDKMTCKSVTMTCRRGVSKWPVRVLKLHVKVTLWHVKSHPVKCWMELLYTFTHQNCSTCQRKPNCMAEWMDEPHKWWSSCAGDFLEKCSDADRHERFTEIYHTFSNAGNCQRGSTKICILEWNKTKWLPGNTWNEKLKIMQ